MLIHALQIAIVAWLPGAALFRLPLGNRATRAALCPEERLFWSVMLSIAISLTAVLAMASLGQYTFSRLLVADAAFALGVAAFSRFDLRLDAPQRFPTLAALLPVALLALAVWRFFPPAEFVLGGRDPGVYVNEGIQIAQRGTFTYEDPVVQSVPPSARDLFFPSHQRPDYYGIRFMGFRIIDPDRGVVMGQFPHLFPASIAIGYGIDGLTGARRVVGVWAALGLVAVYFLGVQLFGRAVGFAGAALLALHLAQVWFARYPSTEIVMQAMLFAALLAVGTHARGRRSVLLVRGRHAARTDAVPASGCRARDRRRAGGPGIARHDRREMAHRVSGVARRGVRAGCGLSARTDAALQPSSDRLSRQLQLVAVWRDGGRRHRRTRWPCRCVTKRGREVARADSGASRADRRAHHGGHLCPVLRRPGGRLAAHDAYALRTITELYLTLPGLAAALIGFALAARRTFWRAPAFFTTLVLYCFFFFYKIYIVPEHFWMSRRYLPLILPAAFLLASAAALGTRQGPSLLRPLRWAIGLVFLVLLGREYARTSQRIIDHVEFAGVIPRIERIASSIGDDDLLIVESGNAGTDVHTLALPLAYIYARNVLVLNSPAPDKAAFGAFLEWASKKYSRVLFLGAGGTDLLSPASPNPTPRKLDSAKIGRPMSSRSVPPGRWLRVM